MIVLAGSAWAHHSPSAIFDMKKKVNITGTLTEVNWVNPHIVVMVDVKKDGATESWKLESNPPAWFRQVGVSRNDMAKALNQTVTVEAVIAVDGSKYGYMQKITLPDGTTMELIGEQAAAKEK
ncbi:MAG TPA: DUF6152 family protein [Humisphaera sp.]|nr:DUF6152 family protein [Humisphaera sp.]